MVTGDTPLPRPPTGDRFFVGADETAFLMWWRRAALLGGVVSIVLGLILMIWPEATLLVAAVLIGLWRCSAEW